MHHLDLEMQGVRVRLRSAFEPLLRHVRAHLPYHVTQHGENVDIDVHVRWIDGSTESDVDAMLAFPGQSKLDRIGKRHLAGASELVWTDTARVKNLAFRFRLEDRRLAIEAVHVYAPRADKVAHNPHYLERRLFVLTHWLVFHPVSWYLEHFRGLLLLHASAVELHGRAIVVAGVGGVGKTTTSVGLMARRARLISENLVYFDACNVYSCYEPLRLDDRSVELLRRHQHELKRADIPAGAKSKHVYHLPRSAVSEVAPAGWLFVPRFTSEAFVRELDEAASLERLRAFNTLTSEIEDYTRFAATMSLMWPTPDASERRHATWRDFVRCMPCYEIGIQRDHGVDPVLQLILEHTGAHGAPR